MALHGLLLGYSLKNPPWTEVVRLLVAKPAVPIWLGLDESQFEQLVASVPAVIGVAAPLHTPLIP